MPGLKTNERPGTRATLRYCGMSAYKVRQVLDLIRGVEYERAKEILEFCDRDAATVIGKLLASAAANAEHNDALSAEELYVSACFADEGATAKRWRPRARGRATRIRKRTCHITVILSRLPEDELRRRRAKAAAEAADRRARRVAGTRRARRVAASTATDAAASDASASPADETAGSADDALADAGHEGGADDLDQDLDADDELDADEGDEDEAEEEADDSAEPEASFAEGSDESAEPVKGSGGSAAEASGGKGKSPSAGKDD